MLDKNIIDEIIEKSRSMNNINKWQIEKESFNEEEENLEENEINVSLHHLNRNTFNFLQCFNETEYAEKPERNNLELELIEVISILPSATIQNKLPLPEKKDVSLQVDIQQEQMESVSAASVHSRKFASKSNNSSISTTDFYSSKSHSSELSTGQLDQFEATYLFAKDRWYAPNKKF